MARKSKQLSTMQNIDPTNGDRPNFIDLFCGCGGFSLGLERAGFECAAAIDFNSEAIAVFKENFSHVRFALERDLTNFGPQALQAMIGQVDIDLVVGGPPCQGFSTVRQVDGANHGARTVPDDRRYLYKAFLQYVEYFQPKVFVMENVLGIRSTSDGEYFIRVQKEARALGYRVHEQIENCVELGVPQKRRRQLFIGTRKDQSLYFYPQLTRVDRATDHPTLKEAIGDLPSLSAGQGKEISEYDLERRQKHITSFGTDYLEKVLEVRKAKHLTAHRARPHSERDLRDFSRLREGESSAQALRRGVQFEFPYDKSNFKDRYTRQSRFEPCSTIVAHLSKDGLMFIHPTQNRSLTPREAARIQTFPDWFMLPVARTHQFRMIGNAVPPLVGEAVGRAVSKYLTRNAFTSNLTLASSVHYKQQRALENLKPLLDLSPKALRVIPDPELRSAWQAISVLFGLLHPESTKNHGKVTFNDDPAFTSLSDLEPRLTGPSFAQSGWPLMLVPIGSEARRRYETGLWSLDIFYNMNM